jgi:hypothetical protein
MQLPFTLTSSALAIVLISLTSCGAAPEATSSAPASEPMASPAAELENRAADQALSASAPVPAPKPQLIRNAEISLEVRSVEDSLKATKRIILAQQGDLMGLNDSRPIDDSEPYTISAQIRVPQARLEATLAELGKLGTLKSQSISAEDVSTQLVDMGARLRNLRRSEEALLNLMNRSGTISDILKVSQELNKTREAIEQIDAQLTSLKNQVAYSKIQLTMQSEISSQPNRPAVFTQLQEAWNRSTRSMGDFSIGMMQFLIWLMVYSPYWAGIAAVVIWLRRRKKARRDGLPPTPPSPPAATPPAPTPPTPEV